MKLLRSISVALSCVTCASISLAQALGECGWSADTETWVCPVDLSNTQFELNFNDCRVVTVAPEGLGLKRNANARSVGSCQNKADSSNQLVCKGPGETKELMTDTKVDCDLPGRNGKKLLISHKAPTGAGAVKTTVDATDPPAKRASGPEAEDSDVQLPFLPQSVWAQALAQLGVETHGQMVGHYYSRWHHRAVVFVDADGTPYYPMLDVIDERDDVFVVVADRLKRLNQVQVSVAGCDRPPTEPRIYGSKRVGDLADLMRPKEKIVPEPPKIGYVIRAVGKCAGAASGGPLVTVERVEGQKQTITIPVNPVYHLAVGVAAAYDSTRVRSFEARTATGDTVARVAESNDRLGLSSLVYVSFYPFGRDFRKTEFRYAYERVQLFTGLDPRALTDYLVVGGGLELTQGLNILVGWRAITKQPVLKEGSGLKVADSFDANRGDVPTRERWETGGVFVGVGLGTDLFGRLR